MKPPGTSGTERALEVAQYVLAAAGVLALVYCIAVYFGAAFFQAKERRVFENERRPARVPAAHATHSMQSTPIPLEPREGQLVGRLEVPRLGLGVMVVEGVDSSDLTRAAGHIPGTALPGEAGNIGIAAHRDTFFRPLRGIRRNDEVLFDTAGGDYRYRVVSTTVVKPDDVQALYPDGRDELTLVTCFPFRYVGAAPDRFIVRAEREE